MKKIAALLIFGFIAGSMLLFAEEDPAAIVKKSRSTVNMDSVGTRSSMKIQDNTGKIVNELVIDQYSSKDKNGLNRTFIQFLKPAKERGTRFLMLETKSGAMNQRIFLPNLGKVRRIAGESEGSQSFMGTDFSYNDMAFLQRNSDLDTYTMLDSETVGGEECYVIEARSKDKDYEYSKSVLWIQKDNTRFVKAELYNKKDQLVKRLEMSNFENIQGRMTPRQTKISTVADNTATIITILKIKYDMVIPDRVFGLRYLETGK